MKRLAILLLFLVQIFTHASAQHILDITLVVSGEGATMQEATGNALRSAIEQTYGTFISTNTAVLNDELIRDEIVSVSSGNIENYEEISHSTTADGTCVVNLQVTVSLSKLTSYAKSKGSSAELAGNTFAMNMKLRKLNKENEKAALENLLQQVEILSKDMYDFKMEVGEPRIAGEDGVLYELLEEFKNDNSEWLGSRYGHKNKNTTTGYYIPVNVEVCINETTPIVLSTINNTLASLSLNAEELEYYKQHTIPYSTVVFTPTNNLKESYYNYYELSGAQPTTYYLRSFEYAEEFLQRLVAILNTATHDYSIVADNNPELRYTFATRAQSKPKTIFTEFYYSYSNYTCNSSRVFAYAALYDKWVGATDKTVKVIRIAEVKDDRNYEDKKFDYGYDKTLLGEKGSTIKTDLLTLFVKEPEMMELTGLQLIP